MEKTNNEYENVMAMNLKFFQSPLKGTSIKMQINMQIRYGYRLKRLFFKNFFVIRTIK